MNKRLNIFIENHLNNLCYDLRMKLTIYKNPDELRPLLKTLWTEWSTYHSMTGELTAQLKARMKVK